MYRDTRPTHNARLVVSGPVVPPQIPHAPPTHTHSHRPSSSLPQAPSAPPFCNSAAPPVPRLVQRQKHGRPPEDSVGLDWRRGISGGPQSRYGRLRRQVHGNVTIAVPPIWLLACRAVLESVSSPKLAQHFHHNGGFLPAIGRCALCAVRVRAHACRMLALQAPTPRTHRQYTPVRYL